MSNSTLLRKFVIFLLISSIIPLVLLGAISYNVSKKTISEQARKYQIENVSEQKEYMELLMEEVESLIANISSIEDIKNVLNQDIENDLYTKLATQAKIGYILSGYTHINGLVSIDIFTKNNNHYHVGDTLNTESINKEVRDGIMLEVAGSSKQVVWSGIEDNVNENSQHQRVITAGKALKVIDSKTLEEKVAGLLVINYSIDSFYNHFSTNDLGKGSYMMILDSKNRLVFFPDKEKIGSILDSSFVKKLSGSEGSFTERINDRQMLVTYNRSQKYNWLLVSLVPISTLMVGSISIRNNTLIILGLCLIIVLLTALFFSKKVVGPINRITRRFKEIQNGSLDTTLIIKETTNDEIGELTKWFNTFLNSLLVKKKMEEELRAAHDELEKRVEIRTAELADTNQSLLQEIASREKSERELRYLSLHDPLTGLNNRFSFEEKMEKIRKSSCCNFSIIVFDVDGLKLVNDSMGHNIGDLLLVKTAQIIRESVRENDFVARIGGDEFAVILNTNDKNFVENICNRIRKAVQNYNQENSHLPLSISIGNSICLNHSNQPDEIFKEADNNMYREKLYQSNSTRSSIVNTMMKALEERDFITEGHVERVQNLIVQMGLKLGFTERQLTDLRLLSQFHDIGKVGIPDKILLKPEALTKEETAIMRRHPEIGYRIAQSAPDLAPIADWILKHHEWWDGNGYPLGLSGEDIPQECRILLIVDAYDAMTSDRPYRKALTKEKAIEELLKFSGIQFDPGLVQLFIGIINNSTDDIKSPEIYKKII